MQIKFNLNSCEFCKNSVSILVIVINWLHMSNSMCMIREGDRVRQSPRP